MSSPTDYQKVFGAPKTKLQSVPDRGWFRILEPYSGSWQQNVSIDRDSMLTYSVVYACITMIAQDVGKLRVKLVQEQDGGWKKEVENPAYSPVLRKPNKYQTRNKFFELWMVTKLIHGNAYAIKVRDQRGVVQQLYLLDPQRVTPLVADDGSIFYRLKKDNLSRLEDDVVVPAREIIHDPMVTLCHPLVGVSPLTASALAILQGLRIQSNSATFFGNNSMPGGIISVPGSLGDDEAIALKASWDANYAGLNAGRVAVLADDMKFERIAVNATDAQLIEQLKLTAEQVCTAFHVPPFMVGVGPVPNYNNVESLIQFYYSKCLQPLLENCESSLNYGLEMVTPTNSLGTQFDLKGLLRMDTATRFKANSDAIRGGWLAPNEARIGEDLTPVAGGNTPYLQHQDYSLAALAKRDESDDPFGSNSPPPQDAARELRHVVNIQVPTGQISDQTQMQIDAAAKRGLPALPPPEEPETEEETAERMSAYAAMIKGFITSAEAN